VNDIGNRKRDCQGELAQGGEPVPAAFQRCDAGGRAGIADKDEGVGKAANASVVLAMFLIFIEEITIVKFFVNDAIK